jgi:hypothetical protein
MILVNQKSCAEYIINESNFILQTAASGMGLRGVLFQRYDDRLHI